MPPSNLTEDQERAYHVLLTRKIATALKVVHESAVARHEEMMEIKQQIQEHARDLDHVDKANLRQAADMASRVGEHSIEQLRKLTRLLESPYFGRIDVTGADTISNGRAQPIYIGVHSFTNGESQQPLVHDWRAPISSMFYDFELGEAYYEAPEGRIICKTQKQAESVYRRVCGESGVRLIDAESKIFSGGVIISTAYLAKGLEFDEIIVPFCRESEYNTAIDRHMLYVAVTRAMHTLAITYTGQITPFLADVVDGRLPSDRLNAHHH